jgi:hypothetical protein
MWWQALIQAMQQNQQMKGGGGQQQAPGGGMAPLGAELGSMMGGTRQQPPPQEVWNRMGYSQPYDFSFATSESPSGGQGFAPQGQQNPWVPADQNMPNWYRKQ